MAILPRGTVTFMFTDIEASTALVQRLGGRYRAVLSAYRRQVREAVRKRAGGVIETHGDGCFCVFTEAASAVRAAIDIQTHPDAGTVATPEAVSVRIGIHTGQAEIVDAGYVGLDVHRAARIGAAAHGGQILVSARTAERLVETSEGVAELRDLGLYKLKGLNQHERLFQIMTADCARDFPALRTQAATVHLPSLSTGFVGRETECAQLKDIVELSATRLVTLTGPGGVGKTRLAVAVGAMLPHAFSEIVFVSLAEVREVARVPSAIGRALGVQNAGNRPVEEVVSSYVHGHAVLLILDNFEHLLSASSYVADLLSEPGSSKVLVTSRAPLRLSGEYTYAVPRLAVSTSGDVDGAGRSQTEAATLFVERAKAAHQDFELTAHNAQHVANICVALDGLPLAIELAASRIRALSPAQLARRLPRGLALLTGGAADLPARQRTLHDTIAWSYELLGADEQALFRQLAVFEGGCSIDAVEAVVESPALEADDVTLAVDGVSTLIDNSLLWRETMADGASRLRMLQTIREFALDELDRRGETIAVSSRHASYYLTVARDSRQALETDEHLAAFAVLDREHDNILAALERLLLPDDPHPDDALRMVDAMGWYWYTRGHVQTGAAWLERTLEAGTDAPAALRAKPCYWLAACLDRQGELARARALMETSVALLQEVDDKAALASALNGLATVVENQGELVHAEGTYRKSLAIYRELGNDWGAATVFMGLASIALRTQQTDLANVMLEEARTMFAEQGDVWSEATTRIDLARVRLQQGRLADAEEHVDGALTPLEQWGEKGHLAHCLELYACIAAARDRTLLAGRLSGAADAVREPLGQPPHPHVRQELENHLANVRHRKGTAFDAAWRQGQHMTLAQALALARVRAPVTNADAHVTLAAEFPHLSGRG